LVFCSFNHADLITFSRSSKSEKCVVHVYVLKWYITQLFLIILFFSLLHLIIIIHLQ